MRREEAVARTTEGVTTRCRSTVHHPLLYRPSIIYHPRSRKSSAHHDVFGTRRTTKSLRDNTEMESVSQKMQGDLDLQVYPGTDGDHTEGVE
jgi:hypothetical protein